MGLDEDRYEHIDILIKAPTEGDSWFDRIFDLVTSFCSDEGECTCGMESMGGSSGTLDQCYDHMRISEKWVQDVRTDDLKLILFWMNEFGFPTAEVAEAYERLHKEAYWHDDFEERYSNLPDDEDEEFELDPEVAPYFSDTPIRDTVLSHLQHYQHCNCLADSGECCQPGCPCKEIDNWMNEGGQ